MKKNIFEVFAKSNKYNIMYVNLTSDGYYISNNYALIKHDKSMLEEPSKGVIKKEERALERFYKNYKKAFDLAEHFSCPRIYEFSPSKAEYTNLIKKENTVNNAQYKIRMELTDRDGYITFRYIDIRILKPVISIITNGKYKNITFKTIEAENNSYIVIYKENELVAIVMGFMENGEVEPEIERKPKVKRNAFEAFVGGRHNTMYFENTTNGNYIGTDYMIVKFDESMSKDSQMAVRCKEMPLARTFTNYTKAFIERQSWTKIASYAPSKKEYNNLVKKSNTVDDWIEIRMDFTDENGYVTFRYIDLRKLKAAINIITDGNYENIYFETLETLTNPSNPYIVIYKNNTIVGVIMGIDELR